MPHTCADWECRGLQIPVVIDPSMPLKESLLLCPLCAALPRSNRTSIALTRYAPSMCAQGYLVWQLVLSAIFLRRRYSLGQLVGVVVSLAGIATVVTKCVCCPFPALAPINLEVLPH